MGWVINHAGELSILLFIGVAVAVLLRLASYANAIWAPELSRWMRRHLGRLVPGAVGSLEHLLLCVLTVLLAGLVLAMPQDGPWSIVMDAPHDAALTTRMLAASAALLALLVFAASQARAAEVSARDTRRYFGRPLSTYRFLRSPWTGLIGLFVFQLQVVLLFAIPLLLPFVSGHELGRVLGDPDDGAVPVGDVFSAIWCAAFGLVGIVLILHLTTSLRTSLLETAKPDLVRRQIEWDLADDAAEEWRDLLGQKERRSRRPFSDWVRYHIDNARHLPNEEQHRYLSSSILSSANQLQMRVLLDDVLMSMDKAEAWEAEQQDTSVRGFFGRALGAIRSWRIRGMHRRADRRFEAFLDAHEGLVEVLTGALEPSSRMKAPAFTDRAAAQSLVAGALRSASEIDTAYARLTGSELSQHAATLISATARLPDRSMGTPARYGMTLESPEVLELAAVAYRDLARIVYSRDRTVGAVPNLGAILPDLMRHADGIKHVATREFAIDQVVTAFIRGVIINPANYEERSVDGEGEDADGDPMGALYEFWRRKDRRSGRRWGEEAPKGSLVAQIEQCAFNELLGHPSLQPISKRHLLALTAGWRTYCALLHEQFAARRSGRSMDAPDLRPYSRALSHRGWLDPPDLGSTREHVAATFRSSSYVSHFTFEPTVRWLVDCIVEPLTLDRIREFDSFCGKGMISDFGMVELIQWQTVVNPRFFSYFPADDSSGEDGVPSSLLDSARALWRFHEEWKAVDQYHAQRLGTWLYLTVGEAPENGD